MSLAGLPEDLARQVRQARPKKVVEKERLKRAGGAGRGGPSEAHRSVHLRAATCDLLARAARAASKVLDASGRDLRRIHATVSAKDGFKQALDSGDPPLAQASLAILEAFDSLGAALCGLSSTIAADVSPVLQVMENDVRDACADSAAEMSQLEQQDAECAEAVKQASAHKDKLAAELQVLMQEQANERGGGLSGWFKKPSSSKLKQAADLQRSAVEDLATRLDRANVAALQKQRGSGAFQETLQDVDTRCKAQLASLTEQLGTAWVATVRALEGTSKRLGGSSSAAPGAAAPGGAPAALPAFPGVAPFAPLASPFAASSSAASPFAGPGAAAPAPGTAPGATRGGGSLAPTGGLGLGGGGAKSAPRGSPRTFSDIREELPGERGGADAGAALLDGAPPLSCAEVCLLEDDDDDDVVDDVDDDEEGRGNGAASEAEGPEGGESSGRDDAASGLGHAAPSAAATAAAGAGVPEETEQGGKQESGKMKSGGHGKASSTLCPTPPLEELATEAATAVSKSPKSGGVGARPEGQIVAAHFGHEVKRLGFEVLWEAEWPSVLKVMSDGEASRVGVCRGDVLQEINGTCTGGKTRADLMPLLKERPLKLTLCRRKDRAAPESFGGGAA